MHSSLHRIRLARLHVRASAATQSRSVSALSAVARSKAEQISADWEGTSATGGNTKNFIGGEFVESKSSQWTDVLDPVSCIALYDQNWDWNSNRQHKHSSRVCRKQRVQNSMRLWLQHRKRTKHGAARVCLPANDLLWSTYIVIVALALSHVALSLQYELRAHGEAIANSIVLEQGKTIAGVCCHLAWKFSS